MLKTSTGDSLDALVALLGITRKEASRATATVRFTLSAARSEVTAIPAGTRVKTQSGLYFNTVDYAEIAAGDLYTDVTVQAEEAGADCTGIVAGGIDTLVDPIAYVASVANIDTSTGGTNIEDDDSLTERAYLAPSKFSCAGPTGAYEYYVREWRSDVEDVKVISPSAGVVDLYITLDDETEGIRLPTDTEKESLEEYINDETIRPLTDQVVAVSPTEIEYSIDLTYYIAKSNQKNASAIHEKVETAVEDYKIWQRSLGLDINPTELIARIRDAGAKRVIVTAPTDIVVNDTELPACISTNVAYGGLEND